VHLSRAAKKNESSGRFFISASCAACVAGRTVSPSYTTRRSSGAMDEADGVLCRFKVFWMFLSPIVVLLVLALVGGSWSGDRWRRTFRSIGIAAILILITVGMTPLGLIAAAPLENRFPQPAAVSNARGEIVFDEGERMIEAAFLAKRYPQARVIFTGGSGSLIAQSKVAPAARELLIEFGVDPDRIIVEDKSRNTEENSQFTAAIVRPEPNQRWLLVTSAFHMPRAIGVFEKAGFDVVAHPVAYRTLGPGNGWQWDLDPGSGFRIFETAVHEWIGLAVYRATGRIDSLFPGPRPP
jgi:uncharacterized SAM-binding protein YcdF (DUF218 family)